MVRTFCPHQRQRSRCKECKGSSICVHQKIRSKCKECGGSSFCEHQKRRSECKDCRGGSICMHQRIRSKCKECGGSQICVHQRRRSKCKDCQEMRINQVDIGSLFLMADSKKRSRDQFEQDTELVLALSLPPEMISPYTDEIEDDCGGSCLPGLFEFTGEASEKPSLTLPNGG